ncbi:xanthine dehydrogenase YagS FAD-binding subunit [Streptosporangium album]|uniref:Xanthine dehydrogenase YagS FAD-binding subunit n=1 Tax=Streptosporangium album TaxID=47479 RepID=A0A7W7RQY8_9ACTN|nr:xanthine dehydrogenase family protein subunit M [Streptosporangium album]MBB4936561.1 xanthine dehydrogenase YagS FAD-binding subunit [Streptosporangium album]
MKEFAYRRATDLRDALIAGSGGARYLGGGTNLVDLMKDGVEAPDRLIDVRQLPFAGIRETPDGGLLIGATTTNSDLAAHPEIRRRYPALSQAVLAGASGQLRNMATVGGNLLQRTRCAYFADPSQACNKRLPGSGCPAIAGEHHNHAILGRSPHCAATHPSDMAVALVAFDAVVRYETLEGVGEIPLEKFYLPVGDTPQRETALPPGALITAVVLPGSAVSPRSRYRKVRERASYAFATVSIAAGLDGDRGSARIALGGVASRPWRARTAEFFLLEGPTTADRFRAAADAELSAAEPLPGNGYKVTLARNLIVAVLEEVHA